MRRSSDSNEETDSDQVAGDAKDGKVIEVYDVILKSPYRLSIVNKTTGEDILDDGTY